MATPQEAKARTAVVLHVGDAAIMREHILPATATIAKERSAYGGVYIVASVSAYLLDRLEGCTAEAYIEQTRAELAALPGVTRADAFAVPNRGCDTGVFFLAAEYLLEHAPEAEWICKMHTKGDAHKGLWRKQMLECVAGASASCCARLGEGKPAIPSHVGMVGHALTTKAASYNAGHINEICQILRIDEPFSIDPEFAKSIAGKPDEQQRLQRHLARRPNKGVNYPYTYVAGTFFWLNGHLWMPFLRDRRQEGRLVWDLMEEGKPDDTKVQSYAHAMERVFGVICAAHGWCAFDQPKRHPYK